MSWEGIHKFVFFTALLASSFIGLYHLGFLSSKDAPMPKEMIFREVDPGAVRELQRESSDVPLADNTIVFLIESLIKIIEVLTPFIVPVITYHFALKERSTKAKLYAKAEGVAALNKVRGKDSNDEI